MSRKKHQEPVILYVYDLSDANNMAFQFGLGAYHSGVAVHGTEYTYGQQGTFKHPPGDAVKQPGVKFRQKVEIGKTNLTSRECEKIFDELSSKWKGKDYGTTKQNCNHFSDAFSKAVLGSKKSVIPGWVNRTAKLGSILGGGTKKEEEPVNPKWKAFGGSGQSLSGKKVVDGVEKKEKKSIWGWLGGGSKKKPKSVDKNNNKKGKKKTEEKVDPGEEMRRKRLEAIEKRIGKKK